MVSRMVGCYYIQNKLHTHYETDSSQKTTNDWCCCKKPQFIFSAATRWNISRMLSSLSSSSGLQLLITAWTGLGRGSIQIDCRFVFFFSLTRVRFNRVLFWYGDESLVFSKIRMYFKWPKWWPQKKQKKQMKTMDRKDCMGQFLSLFHGSLSALIKDETIPEVRCLMSVVGKTKDDRWEHFSFI